MNLCKCLILWALLLSLPAWASTPDSGSLTPPASGQTTTITWTGGPYTGATPDPATCSSLTCDTYTLTVNVSDTFYASNPTYSIVVGLDWASNTNDFDLNVLDKDGNIVCSSGNGFSTSELAVCGQLASGTYNVQVVGFVVANASYNGHASLGPQVNTQGKARYKSGKFSFSNPQTLPGPDDLLFGVQGIEPRVRADALGNIYAAAIQGVPAGTDAWKSIDGGNSWTYLGQPDGAQAASALVRGGGAGGGDEDLAIGDSGNVYVNSLWLGSATQSTSRDGGVTWSANPFSSDLPLVDRQWIASSGNNVLYLTYKQLGALLVGTESVFVAKSFDGGVTWPQITAVTRPEFGIQPGDQGNIEVDPNTGYVYTVFFGANGHDLYIARSTDGGKTFIVKLVYSAQPNTSLVNVFPSLAIDRAGNLFIAFSDSHSAFLTYSRDHATTWSVPVRVSNGSGTKSVIGPWVTAGDAGKVNVAWWGTPALSNNDTTAQWKVFFAQSLNVFDKLPAFAQTAATDVMHVGAICTNGTGCADGTRDLAEYFAPGLWTDGSELIVYSDDVQNSAPVATFIRQTGGTTVNDRK